MFLFLQASQKSSRDINMCFVLSVFMLCICIGNHCYSKVIHRNWKRMRHGDICIDGSVDKARLGYHGNLVFLLMSKQRITNFC
jgi:hypothetical protein